MMVYFILCYFLTLLFKTMKEIYLKNCNRENNRDGDITMPLSLKTIGSASYRDQ